MADNSNCLMNFVELDNSYIGDDNDNRQMEQVEHCCKLCKINQDKIVPYFSDYYAQIFSETFQHILI